MNKDISIKAQKLHSSKFTNRTIRSFHQSNKSNINTVKTMLTSYKMLCLLSGV